MDLIKNKIKHKKEDILSSKSDYDPLNVKIHFLLYLDSGDLYISPLYAKGILALQYQEYSAFYQMMPVDYDTFPGWIVRRCEYFNLKKPFEQLDKYHNDLEKKLTPDEGDIFCQLFLEEYCESHENVVYGICNIENMSTLNYALLNSGYLKNQEESSEYINNITNLCNNSNIYYPFKLRINTYLE